MVKNQISSMLQYGKRLFLSEAFRLVSQILFGVVIFALLYLFLITGFALGMTM